MSLPPTGGSWPVPGAVVDLAEIAILEFVKDLRRAGLRHVAIERHKPGDDGNGRFAWRVKGEKKHGKRKEAVVRMPGSFLSRVRFLDMSPSGVLAVFVDLRPALWPDAVNIAKEKLS